MHNPSVAVWLACLTVLVCAVGTHADCTPGYEPQNHFPQCAVRRSNVIAIAFASVYGTGVFTNYNGWCLTTTQMQPMWTANATMGGSPALETQLSGCFTNGTMCYTDVVSTFQCGCLDCCNDLMTTYFALSNYMYANEIPNA